LKTEAGADAPKERRTLAELYIRQVPSAIGLAYLITGDRHMAEDMAQEAFIRLAGRFGHLRVTEAFDAYLRKTVVNLCLCLSHLRRRRVESAYLERERHEAGRGATVMPDVATREELWGALHQLPSRQRAAVVLRYYEDLPERQVAEILRCSVPAARSLVARAMQTLREGIRGDEE
jgi:RNA polymerase sigma-70 factor (sigma-E family)